MKPITISIRSKKKQTIARCLVCNNIEHPTSPWDILFFTPVIVRYSPRNDGFNIQQITDILCDNCDFLDGKVEYLLEGHDLSCKDLQKIWDIYAN